MVLRKSSPPRVSLVTTPEFPVPGRTFRVRVVPTGGTTGSHCRIWCLAAPPGTKLRKELDESRADRVVVHPLVKISTDAQRFEFDLTLEKGGGYVLQIDELQVGTGFTGGYEDDPRGAPSETIKTIGITTLYVAQPLTVQLGCGADIATLKLFVHDDQIIQTESAVHGEVSPRIDLSPNATPKARIAAETETVRDSVVGLAGNSVSDLVGDIGASLDNLLTKFNAHLDLSGRHYANDEVNKISASFFGATTPESRTSALNEFRRRLAQHARNDSGSGTGSAGYHSTADWTNLPLNAAAPSDALMAAIAHADAWRAYAAHRISSVHKRADGANVTAALPPLLEVHRLFLSILAQASPTPPPTGPAGATQLIAELGFKEV